MKWKDAFSLLLLPLFLILLGCGGGTGTDSGGEAIPNLNSGGSGDSEGALSLVWDANTDSDLMGYKLYYGTASGVYDYSIDVSNVTTYTLTGLTKGRTYYFVATAYDLSHNESSYSNEVSGTAR
jgi:fibronectin type 3 domain-containing protein